MIDLALLEWASPRQAEFLKALAGGKSSRDVAREFSISRGTLSNALKAVRMKAARQGYSPDDDVRGVAPPGYLLERKTIHRKDGKIIETWDKTALDKLAYMEDVKLGVKAFVESCPQLEAPAAPLDFQRDIIPWIQIGDAHLGMLAHMAETGKNFDLKIAESELCTAIAMLIDELPNCERLVINDLGDFTHSENFLSVTEASRHALDSDGRFPKMISVYSRVMRFIVDKALTKAQHVDVSISQGNHSRTNDIWMAELLRVAYGHTGRVHVLNNDGVFIAYRMGKTLVMIHHSDKTRMAQLASVMMVDFKDDYGETDFHYIDVGHIHHSTAMKELPGVIVESWNNLAPADKWAHDAGYRSRQALSTVLRSRTYGEVGRRTLSIEEIQDRLGTARAVKRAYAV